MPWSPNRVTGAVLPLVLIGALVAALRSSTGSTGSAWVGVALLALPIAVLTGLVVSTVSAGWRRSLGDDPLVTAAEWSGLAAASALGVGMSSGLQHLLISPDAGLAGFATATATGLASLPATLGAALALRVLAAGWAHLPTIRRRHLGQTVCGAVALAVVLATLTTTPLGAAAPADAAGATGPCPANVPMKSFDVQAIDVDIPLNRFGDHDPNGRMYVLSSSIDAVRTQERSQKVSIGLRNDPIQPLVIRANQGDCVTITYTNNANGGDFGLHIDGLAFDVAQGSNPIGQNPGSNPARGNSRTYTYYVPNDDSLEGAHYLSPGPGFRDYVNHGLFGALVVEPPGSTYLDPNAVDEARAQPLASGWEAIIKPGGRKSFRENVQLYHEIGDEANNPRNQPLTRNGAAVAFIDPHSDAYRPNTRAINYRSESFMNRLDAAPEQEAHGYGSYTFGDPATPTPRGYLGDPTKFRILNAGSEMFHVFHLHGGGIRWRFNPVADPTFNYEDTGLNKHPTQASGSSRLDSQAFGPGEAYNLEIEGGAGGVQQGAGDFLFHCHIAEHYVAGMWAFWRVYNTRQLDFAPLADRADPPTAVDSTGLIGKTFGGQTITADNLAGWLRPQLPPPGARQNNNDATVWDWTTNPNNPTQYLGEPEDTASWPDFYNSVPGHPTALPGDTFVGNRPVLLFNPLNGRPAYPLMRPHLGMRPPFSPNGHSGAPYLGASGDKPVSSGSSSGSGVDPWAQRADGICPRNDRDGQPTALRRFNVVAVERAVQVTPLDTDPAAKVYVLAQDKDAVLAGTKPVEPLALRANVGDCVAVTFTSELTDINAANNFSQANMHIHHVQFDTQASDGVISGMSYEQAVRPYKVEDPRLTFPAAAGDTVLRLSSVSKFQVGVAIGVGLGTEGPPATGTANSATSGAGPEIRTITNVDIGAGTVTIDTPLRADHPAGQYAGVEFAQYRWFPDVDLDNVFFHDHVDGIHTWAHGLVGQLIVEPKDSTYHDPRTGEEVDSGTIVDIRTNNPLAAGAGVTGSFRELALWQMGKGFGATQDSMFNLRAEPLVDRLGDPALRFSSFAHGDPVTPLPRAYPGDPLVIRTIQAGPTMDTLAVDGHRFFYENRYVDPAGKPEAEPIDTLHYGASERFTLILQGGAGGPRKAPGDYLYFNGIDRRLADGAWGILRVLPGRVTGDPTDPNFLLPLPGTSPPSAPALPTVPGGSPPEASSPGSPCTAGAPERRFDITAVRVRAAVSSADKYAYVPSSTASAVAGGSIRPEPLVMHVAKGECVTVKVTNSTDLPRIGFHLRGLESDVASAGVNVGRNPESTIALGTSRTYRYYVDNDNAGGGIIADLAGGIVDPLAIAAGEGTATGMSKQGLYGAYTIAPAGATFTVPETGTPTNFGAAVDVRVPGQRDYRDFSLILADDEKMLGASFMPYPAEAERPDSVLINYRRAPRDDSRGDAFSSAAFGDPATPLLKAHVGDPMVVHAFGAPGSEQVHAFNMGGLNFAVDVGVKPATLLNTRAVGPWETATISALGGAGGTRHQPGDYFYGDLRRAFTRAGMWGLQRILPKPAACPAPADNQLMCLDTAVEAPKVTITAPPTATNQGSLQIPFSSTDPDARFECSLSGGSGIATFSPCKSPYPTRNLVDGTWTLRVRATSLNGWEGVEEQVSFTVDRVTPRVTANPPGGDYASALQVELRADEPSDIRYTLDGSNPQPASPVYTGPLTIGRTTELRFSAADPAGNTSGVGQEKYVVAIGSEPIASGGVGGGGGAASLPGGVPPAAVDSAAGGGGAASLPGVVPPAAVVSAAPRVDRAPTIELATGRVGSRQRVPVRVTWSARDTTGIAGYRLWRHTDGGPATTVALPLATVTGLTTSLEAGHRYSFSLVATDAAGNESPRVSGRTVTINLRQDSDPAITYEGSWSDARRPRFSAGAARESVRAGDSATIVVPARTRLGLVLATGPDGGKVQVRAADPAARVVTLDLYRPTPGTRRVVWKTATDARTLRLTVLGRRTGPARARVSLDAFVLLRR